MPTSPREIALPLSIAIYTLNRNRKGKTRKRPTPKRLPEKLKLIREHLRMSQSEIARALDVPDRSSISGYERGEREPPLPVLLKYARLAGMSTDLLIDDDAKFLR